MFEPENDLERSLVKASTDPSHRPQFIRDLLDSVIYLINAGHESLDIQGGVLQEGTNINIASWHHHGDEWLPIFSSLKRLQQSIQNDETYLQLNAKDFFEFTLGANVILNPSHDYGKEFLPAEIESMLDGSIFRTPQSYRVEDETKVILGQPSQFPTALVTALSRLFSKHRTIKAAYLAHFFNPARDEVPHTLIGIDTDGNWDAIVGEAGMVSQDVLAKDEIVDFMRLVPGDTGPSHYMLHETKPFYQKSFLRRLFG